MSTTIIHPASIKSLHSELMASTALTPTHHKSKWLGVAISVVAAIAIPIAAPVIASSLNLSAGLVAITGGAMSTATAAAVGGGIVGGVLGAGMAKIQGGGTKQMLMGAAGGAFGGAMKGASNFAADAAATTAADVGGQAAAQGMAPLGVQGGVGAAPDLALQGGSFANDLAGAGAATDVGATLTGGAGDLALQGGAFSTDVAGAAGAGAAAPGVAGPLSVSPDILAAAAAPGTGATAQPGMIEKFLSSGAGDALKTGGGKLATQALTNAMVGDEAPRSPEEAALAAQRNAARARQVAFEQEKAGISRDFMSQAKNINPEFLLKRDRADQLNRLSRAQDQARRGAAARGSRGGLKNFDRRAAFDRSRITSDAYTKAQDQRMKLTAAASQSLPTGVGSAQGFAADLKSADAGYKRNAEEKKNAAKIVGSTIAGVMGYESDEEIKRKQKQGVN